MSSNTTGGKPGKPGAVPPERGRCRQQFGGVPSERGDADSTPRTVGAGRCRQHPPRRCTVGAGRCRQQVPYRRSGGDADSTLGTVGAGAMPTAPCVPSEWGDADSTLGMLEQEFFALCIWLGCRWSGGDADSTLGTVGMGAMPTAPWVPSEWGRCRQHLAYRRSEGDADSTLRTVLRALGLNAGGPNFRVRAFRVHGTTPVLSTLVGVAAECR